jgi:pyrrolysine biosynthesis protein PylC
MKILVIGGKLQGLEITYLAKKAGYFVRLADKSANVPAASLADEFILVDVMDLSQENTLKMLIKSSDVVFPAIEKRDVLERIKTLCETAKKRFIYDSAAYEISMSKRRSNALFSKLGLPVPAKFPHCDFPMISKPDADSGSRGVMLIQNADELAKIQKENVIIESYTIGRSYSIECVNRQVFPITEVLIADDFDCSGIISPGILSENETSEFNEIARKLSEEIDSEFIFDIEVIASEKGLKLLEIDARFPSQTPIAVFHSYNINYVKILAENIKTENITAQKTCIYTQVLYEKGEIKTVGEHIMSSAFPLEHKKYFFGADEALVHYLSENHNEFSAIIIITAENDTGAKSKFLSFLENMSKGAVKNVTVDT